MRAICVKGMVSYIHKQCLRVCKALFIRFLLLSLMLMSITRLFFADDILSGHIVDEVVFDGGTVGQAVVVNHSYFNPLLSQVWPTKENNSDFDIHIGSSAPAHPHIPGEITSVNSSDFGLDNRAQKDFNRPFDALLHTANILSEQTHEREDKSLIRTRIYQADFAYPLIRSEEVFSASSHVRDALNNEVVLSVADHLVLTPDQLSLDRARSQLNNLGFEVRRQVAASGFLLVGLDDTSVLTRARALTVLSDLPWVKSVELDYLTHVSSLPNDPLIEEQWHIKNTINEGIDVGASDAWDIRTDTLKEDDNYVVVAIVDTGIDVNHEDLIDNIWINQHEIPDNGLDDDANGYIDDLYGYNMVDGNAHVDSAAFHGTHVAGIVGAKGDNQMGVSGVSWDTRLMAIKVFNYSTSTMSFAAEGIDYAINNGADIINASFGQRQFSQVLDDAIARAEQADVIVAAAAGNYSQNLNVHSYYPAQSPYDNVVSVSALDVDGHLAEFSNFGSKTVDLAAPGVDILSTTPGNGYEYLSGTSMAAPIVAASLAMAKAHFPEKSTQELIELLKSSVTSGEGFTLSYGFVSLPNVLAEHVTNDTIPVSVCAVDDSSNDGNVADNVIDSDPLSRWSSNGEGEYITLELCESAHVNTIEIAWYKGDIRSTQFSVQGSADNVNWEVLYTGNSSGITSELEAYTLDGPETKYLRITGYGNTSNTWNSISQIDVYAYVNTREPYIAAPNYVGASGHSEIGYAEVEWNDRADNEDGYVIETRLAGEEFRYAGTVGADEQFFVYSEASAGEVNYFRVYAFKGDLKSVTVSGGGINLKDDPELTPEPQVLSVVAVKASLDDGNIASNAIDANPETRWSAFGKEQWIQFELDSIYEVTSLDMHWYSGDSRNAYFDVEVSLDGELWQTLFSGESDGAHTSIPLGQVDAQFIRILCYGNTLNEWNSIVDVEFIGM